MLPPCRNNFRRPDLQDASGPPQLADVDDLLTRLVRLCGIARDHAELMGGDDDEHLVSDCRRVATGRVFAETARPNDGASDLDEILGVVAAAMEAAQ